jgi:Kef-type K+ transport system membrane component KefB
MNVVHQTQVVLTTLSFTAIGLPAGHSFGTQILESVFQSPHSLVNIRSIDEALVIGAALSLSSSAFVLQILSDRGELPTRFGSATLGILLMQDIAVVPLLVLLPLIENQGGLTETMGSGMTLISQLGPTALKTMGILGAGVFIGRCVSSSLFRALTSPSVPHLCCFVFTQPLCLFLILFC